MKAKERWEVAEKQRKEMAGVANGAQPSPDGVPGAAAAAARETPNTEELRRGIDSMLSSNKMRKRACEICGVEEISEDVKEHLTIIARAVVSDMSFHLRRAVASDPRIAHRGITFTRREKRRILSEYKEEISKKRDDKLNQMLAATKLSLSGVSNEAYCTLRSVLCKMGGRGILPDVKVLRDTRNELFNLSMADLDVFATADGWFASPRAVVEMEILR